MKSESLLEYLQDERNFEPVDSFAQFVSETDAETLFILYKVLKSSVARQRVSSWASPMLSARMRQMTKIVAEEYLDQNCSWDQHDD